MVERAVARVAQSEAKICAGKEYVFLCEPRARYLSTWGSDHVGRSPTPTRAHPILRRAFNIIAEELKGEEISKDSILQMAVKAVNDTAGPDGLVPTLLVFGAYPRITETDPPAPSMIQRATAIKRAMTEITKIRAA